MSLLSGILFILYAVLYPPFYLVSSVLLLLWALVSPLISLGNGVVQLILLPLRVLAKLEAAFIFLGVAALTGAVLGLTLHYTSTLTVEWLHQFVLSSSVFGRKGGSEDVVPFTKPEDATQDYPQGLFEGEALSPSSPSDTFAEWSNRKGMTMTSLGNTQLLSSTILEEDDSEDSGGY